MYLFMRQAEVGLAFCQKLSNFWIVVLRIPPAASEIYVERFTMILQPCVE